MFLIDSHCHLDLLNYNSLHLNIQDVINKSRRRNVKLLLTVSTSIKNFLYLKQFTKFYNKNIFLSCGIHPLNSLINRDEILELNKYSQDKRVIAIGETGLDYYRKTNNIILQKKIFREHIRIAINLNKPLLIHTRNSINDTITILKEENAERCQGICHSCTENIQSVKILLDMGYYISFSGIITFKNSDIVRKTAQFVPIDRILIETDSPYLSPVPYRGKENQPAYLYEILIFIANLKKINLEVFTNQIKKNFLDLFSIPSYLLDLT